MCQEVCSKTWLSSSVCHNIFMAVINFISRRSGSPHYICVVDGSRGPGKEIENGHRQLSVSNPQVSGCLMQECEEARCAVYSTIRAVAILMLLVVASKGCLTVPWPVPCVAAADPYAASMTGVHAAQGINRPGQCCDGDRA